MPLSGFLKNIQLIKVRLFLCSFCNPLEAESICSWKKLWTTWFTKSIWDSPLPPGRQFIVYRDQYTKKNLQVIFQYSYENGQCIQCNRKGHRIIALQDKLDFLIILGLNRDADVALATPLRDGMNLFGKQFVACRISPNLHPGVLILSSFVGAADQMQVWAR